MTAPITSITGSFDAPYNENIYFEWALEGMFYPMKVEEKIPLDSLEAVDSYEYMPLTGTVTDISFDMIAYDRPDLPIIDLDIRGISVDLEDVYEAADYLSYIAGELDGFLEDAVDYLDALKPVINITYSHSGDSKLFGGEHIDILIGGSEVGIMKGRDGDDLLIATADKAKAIGGDGNDAILMLGLDGQEKQRGTGADGNDVLAAIADDAILKGGDDNDIVIGAGEDNRLDGNDGNDILLSIGTSTMSGGDGDDFLVTGIGDSSIRGGEGADVFGIAFGYEPAIEEFLYGVGHSDDLDDLGRASTEVIQDDVPVDDVPEGPFTDAFIVDFDTSEDSLFFVSPILDVPSPEEAFDYFLDNAEQVGKHVVFNDGVASFTLNKVDLDDITVANFTDDPLSAYGSTTEDFPFDDLIPYDLLLGGVLPCDDSHTPDIV